MQSEQSNSAVIVCASNQFIVTGIVFGPGEQIVVVFVRSHWQVASADVPKLEGLVVAGHEVALFVGIVIHPQDAVSALLTRVYHEFLT